MQVARTGRIVTLAAPQRIFANERQTVQEGYSGDVIGLTNPGAFGEWGASTFHFIYQSHQLVCKDAFPSKCSLAAPASSQCCEAGQGTKAFNFVH